MNVIWEDCIDKQVAQAGKAAMTKMIIAGNSKPPEELDWIPKGKYDIYALGVQGETATTGPIKGFTESV
jgi:hypothetical protein